jgi:FKBP-type peptidyl-prolyl cis-trans isomerase
MLALLLSAALSTTVNLGKGLTKEIKKEGSGPTAAPGKKVSVHYVGTLLNGKQFDSSRSRGQPFEFTIGQGVIQGWSIGVATMKVGEIAVLTIPSDLGYGDRGAGGAIPPKATLVFEIELLKIY